MGDFLVVAIMEYDYHNGLDSVSPPSPLGAILKKNWLQLSSNTSQIDHICSLNTTTLVPYEDMPVFTTFKGQQITPDVILSPAVLQGKDSSKELNSCINKGLPGGSVCSYYIDGVTGEMVDIVPLVGLVASDLLLSLLA